MIPIPKLVPEGVDLRGNGKVILADDGSVKNLDPPLATSVVDSTAGHPDRGKLLTILAQRIGTLLGRDVEGRRVWMLIRRYACLVETSDDARLLTALAWRYGDPARLDVSQSALQAIEAIGSSRNHEHHKLLLPLGPELRQIYEAGLKDHVAEPRRVAWLSNAWTAMALAGSAEGAPQPTFRVARFAVACTAAEMAQFAGRLPAHYVAAVRNLVAGMVLPADWTG